VRSCFGCLSTACIVAAVPGAVIVKIFDSGPASYIGSALLGMGCAGFLVFTAAWLVTGLFADNSSGEH
jgi:hypothetical protein